MKKGASPSEGPRPRTRTVFGMLPPMMNPPIMTSFPVLTKPRVLMFAIFFTPVLFEADMLGDWKTLVLFNPVAPLLEALYQTVVLARWPDWGWLAYSCAVAAAIASTAWSLFKRL